MRVIFTEPYWKILDAALNKNEAWKITKFIEVHECTSTHSNNVTNNQKQEWVKDFDRKSSDVVENFQM